MYHLQSQIQVKSINLYQYYLISKSSSSFSFLKSLLFSPLLLNYFLQHLSYHEVTIVCVGLNLYIRSACPSEPGFNGIGTSAWQKDHNIFPR